MEHRAPPLIRGRPIAGTVQAGDFKSRIICVLDDAGICKVLQDVRRDDFALRHVDDVDRAKVIRVRKQQDFKGICIDVFKKPAFPDIDI